MGETDPPALVPGLARRPGEVMVGQRPARLAGGVGPGRTAVAAVEAVPDAGHIGSLAREPGRWESTVIGAPSQLMAVPTQSRPERMIPPGLAPVNSPWRQISVPLTITCSMPSASP